MAFIKQTPLLLKVDNAAVRARRVWLAVSRTKAWESVA